MILAGLRTSRQARLSGSAGGSITPPSFPLSERAPNRYRRWRRRKGESCRLGRPDHMDHGDVARFLHGIDEELAKHAGQGERLDVYLIGRSAMILRFGLTLAT